MSSQIEETKSQIEKNGANKLRGADAGVRMKALYDAIASVATSWGAALAINDLTYTSLLARVAACDARSPVSSPLDTTTVIVWMLACMREGLAFDLSSLVAEAGDGVVFFVLSSGSTGTPKRIAVPECVFVPCVEHWAESILRKGDRVLSVFAKTFDPFVVDVLAALLCGAQLLVPPCPPSNYAGTLCVFLHAMCV